MTYFTFNHILEIPAVILCLLGVYLAARGNIWTFTVSIIMAILYGIIDYRIHVDAEMSSQAIFIAFQIYGYYEWRRRDGTQTERISYANNTTFFVSLLVAAMISIFYAYILSHYTQSTLLPLDITTTALSYSALWLLVKKYVQTWWLWIAANLEAVIVYAIKGLYFSSLLYVILVVLAIYGAIQWHKRAHCSQLIKNT